jgi:hypothetical protein
MAFRAYLRSLIGIVVVLSAATGLVNYAVDPYYFFRTPLIEGFNHLKMGNERLQKASDVRVLKPKAIYLGNSRANVGIDPAHAAWPQPPYNLTQNGASFYEMERYLEHASRVSPLETVVMSLDFTPFNVYYPGSSDFNDAFLEGYRPPANEVSASFDDVAAHLISLETFFASVSTVTRQSSSPAGVNDPRSSDLRERRKFGGGQRLRFLVQERTYTNQLWFPAPRGEFSFRDPASGRSNFQVFRNATDICRKNGIDLKLFITPVHARLSYALYASGLWPTYETWKRELVRVVDDEARDHEAPRYPLWDFSGIGSYTSEPPPAPGDVDSLMRWYHESSHYHADLGDLVLDRLFGRAVASEASLDSFGIMLNPDNIERHLADSRSSLLKWIRENPADVAEIDALVPPERRHHGR